MNDDILSRFKYLLYLSYHRFGQKEAKRGRNVREENFEFFRKKREKRETYFQGEDGYKRDKEKKSVFYEI